MREIKFRAWYGEKIGMLEPTFNGSINEIFAERNGEYMQYTGLKDKYGKEIYEGDIVHCEENPVFGAGEDFVGVVKFFEAAFWVDRESEERALHLFNENTTSSVLGNIYENPELLQE